MADLSPFEVNRLIAAANATRGQSDGSDAERQEWTDGLIEGELLPVGWGATLGYPAFRPRSGGDAIAVQVLTSPRLATAWPTLDRFEAPEYRRILVPVFKLDPSGERRLYTVANLYAVAEVGSGADAR